MSLLEIVQNCSMTPGDWITIEDGPISVGQSASIRAMAALQLIVSLIALTLIIIVGTIEAIYRTVKGEFKQAIAEMGNCLKFHLLLSIPASAHAVFFPIEKTKMFIEEQLNFLTECLIDPDNIHQAKAIFEAKKIIYFEKHGLIACI
jgi:hypothetical protein